MARLQLVDISKEVGRMGDYANIKEYRVIDDHGDVIESANGYVVQIVYKQTNAEFKTGTKINIPDSSYIERFAVTNGVAKTRDQFANGSIGKVNPGDGKVTVLEPPYTKSDLKLTTKGQITQRGINLLFITHSKVKQLKALPWAIDKEGPANGLYTLDTTYWDTIVAIGTDSSNVPEHVVKATWDFEDNVTKLKVTYPKNAK